MVKIDFRSGIPHDTPSLENHKEWIDGTEAEAEHMELFRSITSYEPSKLCGIKHEPGLQPNSCQRLICPRCAPRRAAILQAELMQLLAAKPEAQLFHLTLTARLPASGLTESWDAMQSAFGNESLRKTFSRKTLGVFWADGVTRSSAGVWHVHRHHVLAVAPDQVDKLPSLVTAWLETTPVYGLAAYSGGQSLRPIASANAYAVFGYVAQQLSPQHLAGDFTADGPSDLLARCEYDPDAVPIFHDLEAALYKRRSIGARGVFAKQSK